jgi:hypothetical protein
LDARSTSGDDAGVEEGDEAGVALQKLRELCRDRQIAGGDARAAFFAQPFEELSEVLLTSE